MEESNIYQKKYMKEKNKVAVLKKDFKNLESVLLIKEEEVKELRTAMEESSIIEKDKEIEQWKQKYNELEKAQMEKMQKLRDKTEMILRSQIVYKQVIYSFIIIGKRSYCSL